MDCLDYCYHWCIGEKGLGNFGDRSAGLAWDEISRSVVLRLGWQEAGEEDTLFGLTGC